MHYIEVLIIPKLTECQLPLLYLHLCSELLPVFLNIGQHQRIFYTRLYTLFTTAGVSLCINHIGLKGIQGKH